jgi:hypothetical protein
MDLDLETLVPGYERMYLDRRNSIKIKILKIYTDILILFLVRLNQDSI